MTAVAQFYCQKNSDPFQERHVPLSEPIKIGRSVARCRPSPNNAVFDCKVLSRNHAILWFEKGKFYLQDTRSSNGTFVNNQRLSKASEESSAVEVNSCDIVQFGIDVVDGLHKVTHSCIVSQVRLFLPNGEESKQSNSAWNNRALDKVTFNNICPTAQDQDLYQLHQYLQEALHREQMLEQKLALLQRSVLSSHDASEKGWQALIDEDRLLSRLEFLENQLQAYNKAQSEESFNTQLTQIQEEKYNYENTSKETLRQAVQEKLEAVRKLSNVERSLSNSEDECTYLRHVHEQTKRELTSLAASHQVKLQEVQQMSCKLQEVERKDAESKSTFEKEKCEIEKKFEVLLEEDESLKRNLIALEEENMKLKIANEQPQAGDVDTLVESDDLINSAKTNNKLNERLQLFIAMQATDPLHGGEVVNNNNKEIFGKLKEKMKSMEDQLHKLHNEKVEEVERRRRMEEDIAKFHEEKEQQMEQLEEKNRELQAALRGRDDAVEVGPKVSMGRDDGERRDEADGDEFTSESFLMLKAKLQEFATRLKDTDEQLEATKREKERLQEELSTQASAMDGLGTQAFEGSPALVDEDRTSKEKDIMRKLESQEEEIRLLKEEVKSSQETAKIIPELRTELESTQSVAHERGEECAHLQAQLGRAQQTVQEVKAEILSLQDKLLEEHEAATRHAVAADALRERCGEQEILIKELVGKEKEALDKVDEVVEELKGKENRVSGLEEELRDCFVEKEDLRYRLDELNRCLSEADREKSVVEDQLETLEEIRRNQELSLEEQRETNKSLRESAEIEKEEWESCLDLKENPEEELTSLGQQMSQDSEFQVETTSPIKRLLVVAVIVAFLSFAYVSFYADSFPQRPT